MDYVYVTLAWELDIADLKKLSLNGIKYSSVDDKVKQQLYEVFETKWAAWVKMLSLVGEDSPTSDLCESPATYEVKA